MTRSTPGKGKKASNAKQRSKVREELAARRLANNVASGSAQSSTKKASEAVKNQPATGYSEANSETTGRTLRSASAAKRKRTDTRPNKQEAIAKQAATAVMQNQPKKFKASCNSTKSQSCAPERRKAAVVESDEEPEVGGQEQVASWKQDRRKLAIQEDDDELSSDNDETISLRDNSDGNGEESDADEFENYTTEQLEAILEGESALILPDDDQESANSDAVGLFDEHDSDVEMVSRAPSRASSRMSTSDGDLDIEVTQPRREKRKAEKGAKSRRQELFEGEQPVVKAEPKGKGIYLTVSKTDNKSFEDTKTQRWPIHTSLVSPGGLQDQQDLVQIVLHEAIKTENTKLLIENAWPELGLREEYSQNLITTAATRTLDLFPGIQDILQRAKEDPKYCKKLGEIVIDRLATTRSPVKNHALTEIAVYELGTGDKCIQRVASLLEHDSFIFPGRWTSDSVWNPEGAKPFLNPAIFKTLRNAYFQVPQSHGYRALKEIKSDDDEMILPSAMVALAATGVYAALCEWEKGYRNKIKFEGNTYAAVYRRFVQLLASIKSRSPTAYASIMSRLYSEVADSATKKQATSKVSGAQAIMDLSMYE